MRVYQTYAGYGVDVASVRTDDLDKCILQHVSAHQGLSVLELGAGAGGLAIQLAEAGGLVTAVDIHDFSSQYQRLLQEAQLQPAQLSFKRTDIRNVDQLPDAQQVIVLQRTLHYLCFDDASTVLSRLRRNNPDAQLFISVTGLASAIGEAYGAKHLPVSNRFVRLEDVAADTFSIYEPVCLYSEGEFEMLLRTAGWQVAALWTSAFGNHKAIAKAH